MTDHEKIMKEIEENHAKEMKKIYENHEKQMKQMDQDHEAIMEKYAIQRQARIQGRLKRKIYFGKVKTE